MGTLTLSFADILGIPDINGWVVQDGFNSYVPGLSIIIPNPGYTNGIVIPFGDDLTFNDLIYTSQFPFYALSDSFTISDSVNINLGNVLLLFEDILIIDSLTEQETITSLSFTDLYVISDSINSGQQNNPLLNDSLEILDNVSLFLTYDPLFGDFYSLSDATGVQENEVNFVVSVYDGFLLTDSSIVVRPNTDIILTFNDGIDITDLLISSNTESLNTYLRRYLNDVINNN